MNLAQLLNFITESFETENMSDLQKASVIVLSTDNGGLSDSEKKAMLSHIRTLMESLDNNMC